VQTPCRATRKPAKSAEKISPRKKFGQTNLGMFCVRDVFVVDEDVFWFDVALALALTRHRIQASVRVLEPLEVLRRDEKRKDAARTYLITCFVG
jgi:hypothetical protein